MSPSLLNSLLRLWYFLTGRAGMFWVVRYPADARRTVVSYGHHPLLAGAVAVAKRAARNGGEASVIDVNQDETVFETGRTLV